MMKFSSTWALRTDVGPTPVSSDSYIEYTAVHIALIYTVRYVPLPPRHASEDPDRPRARHRRARACCTGSSFRYR